MTDDIFSRVFARNPKERELLQEKHLALVGAGSVGSALALMAARSGIGRFTLVDLDKLEPENVCRHMGDLCFAGQSKVEVVAELIRRINPTAQLITIADDFRDMDRTRLAEGFDD